MLNTPKGGKDPREADLLAVESVTQARRRRSRFLSGLAASLWALTLGAAAAALALAEFGAPVWVFVVLLAWLLTLGLPTLVAILLLAAFWPGPSFAAYLVSAAVLGFVFQFAAVWGVHRGIDRWRRTAPR